MGRTTFNHARAVFLADEKSAQRFPHGRVIDFANVPESYRAVPGYAPVTVTASANAAISATSISVTALTDPIPNGTILDFTGTGKFAKLTAAAAAGATSVTVEALQQQINSGDTATYAGAPGQGDKIVPAGTVMALSGSTDKMIPRKYAGANTAIGLLETDGVENSRVAPKSGQGLLIGGSIYENLLPEATGAPKVLAASVKTELQAAGVGFGFLFTQFVDNR